MREKIVIDCKILNKWWKCVAFEVEFLDQKMFDEAIDQAANALKVAYKQEALDRGGMK